MDPPSGNSNSRPTVRAPCHPACLHTLYPSSPQWYHNLKKNQLSPGICVLWLQAHLHTLHASFLHLTAHSARGCPQPALRIPHRPAHLIPWYSRIPWFPNWSPCSVKGNLRPTGRATCVPMPLKALCLSTRTSTLHTSQGSGRTPLLNRHDPTYVTRGEQPQDVL